MDTNGVPWPPIGGSTPYRPPTVEEALPYTPLSSIVPFSPDVISFPTATPSSNTSVFPTANERQAARDTLEDLDNEARVHGNTSVKLERTLQHLHRLLNPNELTQFVFKAPSTTRQSSLSKSSSMPVNGSTNSNSVNPKLGHFAKLALNSTNVSYKCKDSKSPAIPTKPSRKHSTPLTQNTPVPARATQAPNDRSALKQSPQATNSQQLKSSLKVAYAGNVAPQSIPTQQMASTKPVPPRPTQNEPMVIIPREPAASQRPAPPKYSQNEPMAIIPVKRPQVIPQPSQTPNIKGSAETAKSAVASTQSSKPDVPSFTGPTVVVSALPSSQRSEYISYDHHNDESGSPASRKRKREDTQGEVGAVSLSRDQLMVNQAIVTNFQNFLLDAFEADDAGEQDSNSMPFFTTISVEGADVRTFTPEALHKFQSHLLKVVNEKQFENIPVDYLRRAERFCEGAVLSVPETSIAISESWVDSDVEEWSSRITDAGDGLAAVKTLLQLMNAARSNKQLCPEELIQSMITAVKHVFDTCLIPIVEAHTRTDSEIPKIATKEKKNLVGLLTRAGNILRMFGQLFINISVTEEARSSIEDLVVRLLFVENASSETNSVLGVQKFENVRKKAMDVVTSIFTRYPEQRDSIITSNLSSLSTLPVTRQSARQFRTSAGKSIQMITALFIRLTQSSGTRQGRPFLEDAGIKPTEAPDSEADSSDSESDSKSNSTDDKAPRKKRISLGAEHDTSNLSLKSIVTPLGEAALNNANKIVSYMVQRAQEALKGNESRESPYQKLLEIFAEDLVTVFVSDSSEWPAAEILLRVLLHYLITTYKDPKAGVSAKNMALDLMGLMAGGISELQSHLRQSLKTLASNEADIDTELCELGESTLKNDVADGELYAFEGPYRVTLEYLLSKTGQDLHLQSAIGYSIVHWAQCVVTAEQSDEGQIFTYIGNKLKHVVLDNQHLRHHYEFQSVSDTQARLASAIISLRTAFGQRLPVLLNVITSSTNSNSALTKSRGLKVLMQLSEKDPSLLKQDAQVMKYIRVMARHDASALTRDSALQLLQKSCAADPQLDKEIYADLLAQCIRDPGPNPKKRSIRFLKEIYLRNTDPDMRSRIAAVLLQKLEDIEDTVVELAKQSLEELWVSPFRGPRDAQLDVAFKTNVSLIVAAFKQDPAAIRPFESWISSLLDEKTKSRAENSVVFRQFVTNLFERFVDKTDVQEQKSILKAAAVFAKANPQLLSRAQLVQLTPFLNNLKDFNELEIFVSAVEICTSTIRTLITSAQDTFLTDVDKLLFANLSKLPKDAVYQAALCLNVLTEYLDSTKTKIANVCKSILRNMRDAKDAGASKVKKWIILLGAFGNAYEFSPHLDLFQKQFPEFKGTSVLSLFVDGIRPNTDSKAPAEVREAAFQAIGLIGLKRPKELNRKDILEAMQIALRTKEQGLDLTATEVIRDYFHSEEKRSESGAVIAVGQGPAAGVERMGTSLNASEHDGISTTLAQTFLDPIKLIALETADKRASVATEVLVSISRQGLVHPSDCVPALVALGTSDQDLIATMASKEHDSLHKKYESIISKKYHEAVQQSFKYQRQVLRNSRGASLQPFTAKLKSLFSVMKEASSKVRRDFLKVLSSKLQFDFDTLETSDEEPEDLYFARYVLENLAAADYVRLDEVLVLTDNLMKIFSSIGTIVAESIDGDILKPQTPTQDQSDNALPPLVQLPTMLPDGTVGNSPIPSTPATNGVLQMEEEPAPQQPPKVPPIDPIQLRRVTVASMILSMILETRSFLRRFYALDKIKEKRDQLTKAPQKVFGVIPDKYWQQIERIMSSLANPETMVAQCQAFSTSFSQDTEHRVGSDDEDAEADIVKQAAGYATPDEGEETGSEKARTPGSGRGRKRKSSAPASGGGPTPKKKRGRPPGAPNKKTQAMKGRRGSTGSRGDE